MTHDARAIANLILDFADKQNVSATNMSLVKLIYFAHGWHLALSGNPLVGEEEFVAWQYGPVIKSVYRSFKEFGDKPIKKRAYIFEPIKNSLKIAESNFSEFELKLIEDTVGTYGHLHAYRLSELTHEPGSPWDQIWSKGSQEVVLGMRIPNELILKHFLKSEKGFITQ